jgi:MFS transporter, ACS family, hexuronate transporter
VDSDRRPRVDPVDVAGPPPAATARSLVVPVAALFAAQFLVAIVPLGVGALAPFLRTEYGLQRSQVGLTTATIFVAVAACSVPAGRVADAVGVGRAILASCLVVAAGTLGLGLLTTPVALGAALLLVGVGYSLISPATNKGVIGAAPARLRGRAMGVKQMGVTAGAAVAAATLPLGVQEIGITATLVILAAVIAAAGAAAATVVGRVVGRRTTDAAREDPRAGVARRPDPARRRRVLRLGAAVGGMVAAQHVVATYLTLFLVDRRGMSLTAAAALLTVLHLSGTIARLGWGWVSDLLGSPLITMAAIGSVSIAALLALATIGAAVPAVALVALVIVLGTATQGGNAVYQVAIAEEDVERAGWASGVGMALGFTGAIVAPPVFGASVDASGSYAVGLALTACVVAASVAVAAGLARSQASTRAT